MASNYNLSELTTQDLKLLEFATVFGLFYQFMQSLSKQRQTNKAIARYIKLVIYLEEVKATF